MADTSQPTPIRAWKNRFGDLPEGFTFPRPDAPVVQFTDLSDAVENQIGSSDNADGVFITTTTLRV